MKRQMIKIKEALIKSLPQKTTPYESITYEAFICGKAIKSAFPLFDFKDKFSR